MGGREEKVMVLQNPKENRRNEKYRKEQERDRFGHTGLNSTLFLTGKHHTRKCDCSREDNTMEHVLVHCQKCDAERRKLIQKLGYMKVKLDLLDLLCKNSKSEGYQVIFCFLRHQFVWKDLIFL